VTAATLPNKPELYKTALNTLYSVGGHFLDRFCAGIMDSLISML
jgi:hypothetical protein